MTKVHYNTHGILSVEVVHHGKSILHITAQRGGRTDLDTTKHEISGDIENLNGKHVRLAATVDGFGDNSHFVGQIEAF